MIQHCLYLVLVAIVVFLSTSIIRNELREMDAQDQDWAVARYVNLKGQSVIDTSEKMKAKLAAITADIRRRWGVTPEELVEHFYVRHGISLKRLPLSLSKGVKNSR